LMGATGPYNAVVAEVHDGGSEYTLNWEDDDPNGRRQPAVNITARPDFSNTRKSAASHFTHLSPQLKAAEQAEAQARRPSGLDEQKEPAAAPPSEGRDAAEPEQLQSLQPKHKTKARPPPKTKPEPQRKPSKRIQKAVKKGKIVADFSVQGLEKAQREKEQKEREKEQKRAKEEKERLKQQAKLESVAKSEPKKSAGPVDIADLHRAQSTNESCARH